jgi:ADP-heptose:LPS heptosyltransferase
VDAKPSVLVLELWGVGDVALAMRFLEAAAARYSVTLLAKPHAAPLLERLMPGIELIPFVAPWTAFRGKYQVHAWPWAEIARLLVEVRRRHFDAAVSARCDPRDHALLWLSGAAQRVGFAWAGSQRLLTEACSLPKEPLHRHEAWRLVAHALGLRLSERVQISARAPRSEGPVILHAGAAQPVRVWPLERVAALRTHLSERGFEVRVLCDALQREGLARLGVDAVAPNTLEALMNELVACRAFVGNDSGPGHIAAALSVPTFTIFGPQLPEMFLPVHPRASFIPGRPCPYKPCYDSCRFARPHCIEDLPVDEVIARALAFLETCRSGAR